MGFLKTFVNTTLVVTLLLILAVTAYVGLIYVATIPQPSSGHFAPGSKIHTEGLSWSFVTTPRIGLNVVTAGSPSAPLVIFLHGFPETALLSWHHQLHFFGQEGKYFVVAPDMRGYNTSEKPDGVASYRLNELAQDVIDLINYYGKDSAIVVGHDWGAAVAWWTAINHPTRVSKLAILNVPHPAAMEKYLLSHFSQLRKSWYIFFFQLPFVPELRFAKDNFGWPVAGLATAAPGTFGQDDLALYHQSWNEPKAIESSINFYRAALRFKLDDEGSKVTSILKENSKVRPKTLILWGEKDAFLESPMAELSTQFCYDATLKYLDASHWVQHERPTEVNQNLKAFFDQ